MRSPAFWHKPSLPALLTIKHFWFLAVCGIFATVYNRTLVTVTPDA
jgi:hypothetical protein